ncbi:helix-turn-helix domain-containing protein [Marimonas lutisalis]|uniref:helix-turn-helix domain-containing protein n=1 Tax=Marimonas lutisalis TaxID=2545756 RepID=UPI0013760651|nr:helix-turn-helix domain-containing protein [Marimonas lutisalis]
MFDEELENIRREIGARLRARRKEVGLRQCEVAQALGHTSSSRINQIELGRMRLYAEELP